MGASGAFPLLGKMLCMDPSRRTSATEALQVRARALEQGLGWQEPRGAPGLGMPRATQRQCASGISMGRDFSLPQDPFFLLEPPPQPLDEMPRCGEPCHEMNTGAAMQVGATINISSRHFWAPISWFHPTTLRNLCLMQVGAPKPHMQRTTTMRTC